MAIRLFALLAKAGLSALICLVLTAVFPLLALPDAWWRDWQSIAPRSDIKLAAREVVLLEVRDDPDHRGILTSLLPTDRGFIGKIARCVGEQHPKALGIDVLLADEVKNDDSFTSLAADLSAASRSTKLVIANYDYEASGAAFAPIAELASAIDASQGNVRLLSDKSTDRVRFSLPARPRDAIPRNFADAVVVAAYPDAVPSRSQRTRILWGAGSDFTRISSADVFRLCTSDKKGELGVLFRNKIVLFGSVAQNDRHSTPLDPLISTDGLDGLSIHAAIVAQRLAGIRVQDASYWLEWLLGTCAAALAISVPSGFRWLHVPIEVIVPVGIFILDAIMFYGFDVGLRSGMLVLCYAFALTVWIKAPKFVRSYFQPAKGSRHV